MASRLAARRHQASGPQPRPISLKRRHQLMEATSNEPSETLHFGSFFDADLNPKFRAFGILAIYAGIRFGFSQQIDSLGPYASYLFESLFVLILGSLYWDRIRFKTSIKQDLLQGFGLALILGLLAEFGTKPLGLVVPFDVSGLEAIAMLTVVGPILEELIFRMALWNPLLDIGRTNANRNGESRKSLWLAAIGSSILFSYAHYHVSWFLPAGDIRNFVLYQTIYVLVLAAHCAYRYVQTNSVLSPILVHVGFNVGFFVGLKLFA